MAADVENVALGETQVSVPVASIAPVATVTVDNGATPRSGNQGMQSPSAPTGESAPVVVAAAPVMTAEPMIAPAVIAETPAAPAAVADTFERTVPIPIMPIAAPEAVVIAEVVAPTPVPVPVMVDASVVVVAPVVQGVVAVPVLAAAPAPEPVDLKPVLAQVGLIMIETQNAAPREAVVAEPVVLGRKPRPQVQIAAEPLQMVETRSE